MDFKLLEAKAKALGISEIELYTKADTSISITAFDDEISEKTEAVTKVYAIRGVYNNQIGSVYTEKDTEMVISLPMFPELTKEEQQTVAKTLIDCIEKSKSAVGV